MSLVNITLNQIIVMFLLMMVGYFCFKFKVINEAGNKFLSNFMLTIIVPIMIFNSYQRDFSKELLNGLLLSFALGVIAYAFSILVAYIFLKGKNEKDVVVERFSIIFSNCGFIGIPLVDGVFGSEGVFYLTAYITIFNVLLWTFGVTMMTNNTDKKSMLMSIFSPTIITIIISIIFFLLQIRLPNTIFKASEYLGSLYTPLGMIVAGGAFESSNFRKVFCKPRLYLVSFLKLLVVPGVLLLMFYKLPISNIVITTTLIAAACPTGTTGTLFALRYDKNAMYASETFVLTTILSAISIPGIMMLTEFLLK